MTARLLLDTHILFRWLTTPGRLSRGQARVLRAAARQGEPVGLSAITLLELAVLFGESTTRTTVTAHELFASIESSGSFHVLPFDIEIAAELAALGDSLRDPADRAIVATARVHRLRLVTSDRRIIESSLVAVVE